jgi:DNA-binding response OmpR family regulator
MTNRLNNSKTFNHRRSSRLEPVEIEQAAGTSLPCGRVVIVSFDLSMPVWIPRRLADSGYCVDVFPGMLPLAQLKGVEILAIMLCMYADNAAGYAFWAELRRQPGLPVGVLLGGGDREETITLLNQGVDAVWTYPMAHDELFARIQALLRRSCAAPVQLSVQNWEQVSLRDRQVQIGDRMVHLSGREYQLLSYLVEHANQTIGRQQLLQAIWHTIPQAQTSVVDVTIRRLRTKIEENPSEPKYIVTVHKEGYQFVSQPAWP